MRVVTIRAVVPSNPILQTVPNFPLLTFTAVTGEQSMAIRIFPLILTISVVSLISASLARTSPGQEFSRASFTRQLNDDDELPPIVVPSVPIVVPGVPIEQAVQRQPAAERFPHFRFPLRLLCRNNFQMKWTPLPIRLSR